MVSKKYWEKAILEFANLVKCEKEIKEVEIEGYLFKVFPGVFSPVYSSDTAWFAKKIVPLTKNKNFLEIGSGTGVIACLAALNGANVVATDINPCSIENIRVNTSLHELKISIREGSLFSPLSKNENFDLIFWNHPFYFSTENAKNDYVLSSVYDSNYNYLKEFFCKAKDHLNQGGLLLLGTSNVARLNYIKKFAKLYDYQINLRDKTDVPVYKEKRIKMDLRIYSFTPT